MTVFARYLLFQVPAWVAIIAIMASLHVWLAIPIWVGVATLAAWIVKDLFLFPFFRSAYEDTDRSSPPLRLVGRRGVAEQDLSPDGYVRIQNELWRGTVPESHAPVPRGRPVRVRSVEGMTLLVEPDRET